MSEMKMEDAVAALTSANAEDEASHQPAEANQPKPDTQSTPVETPRPETPEPFTSVGLDGLSEEQRAVVEQRLTEMQGDYTRKTQELASQRQEAEQAIEFVQALQTNPDFALQVRDEISQALETSGYSPQEAQAIANQQVNDAQNFEDEVDPMQQRLDELLAWKEDQEERQVKLELENELDRMDARLRQENPQWKDEDMEDIYRLAYSTGGNLVEAADMYRDLQQRLVGGYVEGKQTAQSNEPGATGPAQTPPEKFDNLLDPRLMQAAKRMLLEAGED